MKSKTHSQNLIQKGPQNPSLCRALLNHKMFYPVCHKCRNLSIECFFLLLFCFVFTFHSTTSLDIIIIVYCTSVACLYVLCRSCCCRCVVVQNNRVLL